MDKKLKTIGGFIIDTTIIWEAVIVGSASVLKGRECYGD